MIYPARGKKQIVPLSIIGCLSLIGVAAVLIWGLILSHHPVLASVLALGYIPLIVFIFVASTRRDLRRWQYEIRGTDLIVTLPRTSCTVPISTIEKVVRTTGNARLWIGDALRVSYVPGAPWSPLVLSPEDPEALLRGLSEADPGLTYRGDEVSRTG